MNKKLIVFVLLGVITLAEGAPFGELNRGSEVVTPAEGAATYLYGDGTTNKPLIDAAAEVSIANSFSGKQANASVFGTPSTEGLMPLRSESSLIISTTADYLGFPAVEYFKGINKLFAVYRKGASHADSGGVLMATESYDFGQVWTTPYLFLDDIDPAKDVRDPSLKKLRDGRLFLTYIKRDNVGGTNALTEICFRVSQNAGTSFGPEVLLVGSGATNALFGLTQLQNATGIEEMEDGSILLPFYENFDNGDSSLFIAKTHITNDLENVATWGVAISEISTSVTSASFLPNECDVVDFGGGNCTAIIRCEDGTLRYQESVDYFDTQIGSDESQISPHQYFPCKPESVNIGNGRVVTLARTDGQGGFEWALMTSLDSGHSYRYMERRDLRVQSMYAEYKYLEDKGIIFGVSANIRSAGPTYEIRFDMWRTGPAKFHDTEHSALSIINTNTAVVFCDEEGITESSWTNSAGLDLLYTGSPAVAEGGYHGDTYLQGLSPDDYPYFPGDTLFTHEGGGWTAGVRFRYTDIAATSGILQSSTSSAARGINLRLVGASSQAVSFTVYNGIGGEFPISITTRDDTVAVDEWHNLVVRFDDAAAMATIYIDGSIVFCEPWNSAYDFASGSAAYKMRVGRGADIEVSHVEIDNTALTDSEVSEMMGRLVK